MRGFVRGMLALASVALFAPALEAQGKPVVAVLYFENNSIGKDRADFEGIGKGIADMLITDMSSNPNVTVVERERIQSLIVEQNLVKSGTISPETAIRLGRIIGAQYMITGGFMSDAKGTYVLTARAINVETSAIINPVRLTTKGDDVLALMAQLSEKLNKDMKLPAMRVGQASGAQAVPAGQPKADAQVQMAEAKPAEAKPADHGAHHAAKADEKPAPTAAAAKPKAEVAQAKSTKKMDMKTVILLSKAIEAEDSGNRTKALELYRQVNVQFPDYAPAKQKVASLSRS